ncbi:MAG: GrpB family protein [Actinomycetota bacterium]
MADDDGADDGEGDHPDRTVEVVPSSPAWPERFRVEREALSGALDGVAASIEHVGSTAVPGLAAKPTIDILIVVESIEAFLERLHAVEDLGYRYRPFSPVGSETHHFLRRVEDGRRTHHLHVLAAGSPEVDRFRGFRDALRRNADLAAEYERLKLDLATRHADDRDRYVAEKSAWVDGALTRLGLGSDRR